ncbi:MAG: hypothetical protein P8182_17645 [Deltaproteobacteria bacterium]
MKEQLQLLARLREVDDQIDYHESNMTRLPLEVQEIARNLVTLRRDISERRDKLSEIEKELRQKERDLGVEQEKIKLSEKRLLNIKNQKEYNALSRQVKLGKKVTGEIEEIILGFMAEIEGLGKAVERKEKEYAEFEETLKRKKTEEAEIAKEAKGALASLNEEKTRIAEALGEIYFKKYTTVKKALGSAVAEMENGSCTACHMAIPPQLNIRKALRMGSRSDERSG